MRLLGQRPRYQEGPPEGAGPVRWPPSGAASRAAPTDGGALRGQLPQARPGGPASGWGCGAPGEPSAPPIPLPTEGLRPEGTPDRSKLFGSHGQRPWFYEIIINRSQQEGKWIGAEISAPNAKRRTGHFP